MAPRDGLQNEATVLPPPVRAELVARLRRCGLRRIEAVSFVRDDRVPAMAGPEAVVAAAARSGADDLAGLVLNERGYARLAGTALANVHIGVAMTESFGLRNANAGRDRGLTQAERLVARARADGRRAVVALIVAFGCPFEGRVDPGLVRAAAARMVEAGAAEISLADTIGVATRSQVAALVRDVRELGVPVGVHLHDTRNMGVINAWTALENGARTIDTSTGGIGGCPFAPRATGNLATEDLLYLLDAEGVETGVSLEEVISTSAWLGAQLHRELPSRVSRAAA